MSADAYYDGYVVMKDQRDRARDRIAELEDALRWRSVEDELPESKELVEACRVGPATNTRWLGCRSKGGLLRSADGVMIATHWRPLGPLPEEE